MGNRSSRTHAAALDVNYGPSLSSEHEVGDHSIVVDRTGQQFRKVPAHKIVENARVIYPVYFRLSQDSYMKYFEKDESIDGQDIEELCDQGMTELYVERKHLKMLKVEAIDSEGQILNFPLRPQDNATYFDHPLFCFQQAFELLQENLYLLSQGGSFETEFRRLEFATANLCFKHSLKEVLDRLSKNGQSLHLQHSIMIALLGEKVLCEMNFEKSDRDSFLYACILHDSLIEGNISENLDFIGTNGHTQGPLSDSERQHFFNHPFKTAEFIRERTDLSKEVETIIFEHHEAPNGMGFPQGLSPKRLHPLSRCFIFLHEFVEEVFLNDLSDEKIKQRVREFRHRYSDPKFSELWKAMETFVRQQ